MTIDITLNPPQATDTPADFDQKAFQLWVDVQTWVNQVNSTAGDMDAAKQVFEGQDIQDVLGIKDDISAVAAIDTAVSAVYANETNINAVNSNKTNIDKVAVIDTDVTKVSAVDNEVAAVASIDTEIVAVDGNKANINSVAGNKTNINKVAAITSDVTKVASIDTDVSKVSVIDIDVSKVANIDTDVTAVAAVDAEVEVVANNIPLLNLASSVANFKGKWTTLTGALNVPATTFHDNKYWQLLENIADVPAEEPGVSNKWAEAGSSASGTVTSVGLSVPTGLTVTGSPITASGTLAIALDTGYVIPKADEMTSWKAPAIKTAAYTAQAGDQLGLDTSAGAFNLTLPASPKEGDKVRVFDAEQNWDAEPPVVLRNGSKIQGKNEDLELDILNAHHTLMYVNSTLGWVVIL